MLGEKGIWSCCSAGGIIIIIGQSNIRTMASTVLVKRLQLCAVTAASTAVAETYGRNFSEK
jgi:hypothetical protein